MKKITIDGMMCEHCVAHVKEALEGLGATSVTVSLEGGYAECETGKSDGEIKSAIEEEGYTVTQIS
ncbi:MAG: cation transporter [Ruminococcus sp.]|nr:cation transporter [Ruminococcus sp.]MCM1381531.1 cation transporter [Muribaculaceae bacterium]MCM1479556.1 cation transporter [Muribaculaceae bacterium]